MENFIAYNPTSLHFGKGIITGLGACVLLFGKKVLFVYGKGSIQKNGIYQKVMEQLITNGCEVFEYSGIKANPVIEDVNVAATLGKENEVDVIVAVGGGSVIDSAKIISIAIPVQNNAWDFFTGKIKPKKAIPLIAVLTLAATGTEMNPYAVVQNNEAGMKPGYGHKLLYPKHSFLDPAFTLSVPKDQTAFGIVDLIAHSLEAYFGKGDASLSDRFIYAVIKEAFVVGPKLISDLNNYEYREKIMYAATCALNGTVFYGRAGGDWGVHEFGHVFSLIYDMPHGASLSLIYPAWLKLQKDRIPERITTLGKELFGITDIDKTIKSFEDFFNNIGSPTRLGDAVFGNIQKDEIISLAIKNKVSGEHHKLDAADYSKMFGFML